MIYHSTNNFSKKKINILPGDSTNTIASNAMVDKLQNRKPFSLGLITFSLLKDFT